MDLRQVVEENAIDLWVCDYYKVLPTDSRFKELSDRQKELLFRGFLELPDFEALRIGYQSKSDTVEDGLDEKTKQDLLEVCGYSAEDVAWFDEEIRKANGQ